MTDDASTAAAPDAAQPSQILSDAGTHENPSKGSMPEVEPPKAEDKPLSTRDAIAKAFDEAEAKSKAEKEPKAEDAAKAESVKDEPKPEKAEKPRGEDGKFAKGQEADPKAEQGAPEKAASGQEATERRQSEGPHREPPARFLPEARAKWANVPNEVKAEFHRVSQEYETEIEHARQAVEAYESVKEYDELAKNSGTTMKAAMANYVAIDRLLHENPRAGMARVLQTLGLTPQQYAQDVLKNPNAHQFQPQQAAPRQPAPQADPEVSSLKQEVASLKEQMIIDAARPMIRDFAESHPDYHDLEPQMAAILKSGVVDQIYGTGLSPAQKLEQAYRMAGGSSPSRSEPEPAPVHSDATSRPVDPDGQKSTRGAPTAGKTPSTRPQFKTNREALERAFADAGIR